ncbi:MAG: hypothetical protein R6V75_08005, partial [Bacteroidales bacterium]
GPPTPTRAVPDLVPGKAARATTAAGTVPCASATRAGRRVPGVRRLIALVSLPTAGSTWSCLERLG